jgi:organic radical activating enzyme
MPGVSTAETVFFPRVPSLALDTLWFQVAGTLCNLQCTHCFIACSPSNHSHEMLSLADVRKRLVEAVALGVREYYFTGGEPFLNPEMMAILEETLRQGPATVLTNGLLPGPDRCRRLKGLCNLWPVRSVDEPGACEEEGGSSAGWTW